MSDLRFCKRSVLTFSRSSYNKESVLPKLLNDAMCLPLFDGGNIGIRRRELEQLFMAADYQPWASAFG